MGKSEIEKERRIRERKNVKIGKQNENKESRQWNRGDNRSLLVTFALYFA
jgi:hypothetical protein